MTSDGHETPAAAPAARRLPRLPFQLGRRFKAIGLGLVIVLLSVTTCSFGVDPASLTEAYGPPIEVSAEAAIRFAEKGAQAMEGFTAGNALRLAVTEAEVTSALSLGLMLPDLVTTLGRIAPEEIRGATDLLALRERVWAEQQAIRDSVLADLPAPLRILEKLDPRIRTGDVQVRFQEGGQVVVGGFVQAWSFRQPLMFVVAPRAGAGQLELDFVRGRLGRIPAPAFVFDLLGEALARGVLLGRGYAEVSEITVAPGSLVFEGRLTR